RGLTAARAHRIVGEWTRSRSIADDLLAAADPGPGRAEVLVFVASLESEDRAARLVEEALHEARTGKALSSTTRTRRAVANRFRDGFPAAVEHARLALALAEEVDDDALRVAALTELAFDSRFLGDADAPRYAARARELAGTLGDARVVKQATSSLAA